MTVDWHDLLPSELESLREEAVAAGYVSPFPEPGEAPVTTIEDRCEGCGKTKFVTLQGEIRCPYERCTEHTSIESVEA